MIMKLGFVLGKFASDSSSNNVQRVYVVFVLDIPNK